MSWWERLCDSSEEASVAVNDEKEKRKKKKNE